MKNNCRYVYHFTNLKEIYYQRKEFERMKTEKYLGDLWFALISILYMKYLRNQTVWGYYRMIQSITEVHKAGYKRLSNKKVVSDETKVTNFNSELFSYR